jgi:hypothetical protein
LSLLFFARNNTKTQSALENKNKKPLDCAREDKCHSPDRRENPFLFFQNGTSTALGVTKNKKDWTE